MLTLTSARGGGIAGIVFVVSLFISALMVPPPPGADAPSAEFLEYFVDNRGALMLSSSLSLLPTLPLFVFVPALWRRLSGSDGANRTLPISTIAGILLGWVVGLIFAMVYGGVAYLSDSTLDADNARNFALLVTVGYSPAVFLWGVAALSSGLILAAGRGMERWVGWFGVLVFAICTVVQFSWADDGVFAPGDLLFAGYMVFMLYIVVLSILLIRTPRAS